MIHNPLEKTFTTSKLLKFAFPNLIMMVFLSLYTIVDGIFISRYVGTLALSAVNMSYPITSLELAIGIMLGTGGSAVIAKTLGEGDKKTARQDFTCIFVVSIIISVFFAVFAIAFLDEILNFLGTSEAQFVYCKPYTTILLTFAPALFLQCIFQILFVTAGKPMLGLISTLAGGFTNMILDYVFMGHMGMGVEGAAIATVISYFIPAITGIIFFTFNRSGSLFFVPFKFKARMLIKVCGNGSSEMVTNLATSITTLLFNILFMRFWQEDGVAAITIVMYLQFVFSAAYMGFSIGVAPIISYKYGAMDSEQLKNIIKDCIRFIIFASIIGYVISMIIIKPALSIFTNVDSRVYTIALEGFPIYAISFLLMGISIFASAMFTAFSNGVVSAIISFGRTFVFLVCGLLILPEILDAIGIWIAVPFAEGLGLIVSIFYLIWGRKKYLY